MFANLIESSGYDLSQQAKEYKIFIIDEAHMLSKQAFNAPLMKHFRRTTRVPEIYFLPQQKLKNTSYSHIKMSKSLIYQG